MKLKDRLAERDILRVATLKKYTTHLESLENHIAKCKGEHLPCSEPLEDVYQLFKLLISKTT